MTQLKLSEGELLVGRYEIIRYIAAGGMQEVYLAYDHALRRQAALKTPKSEIVDRRFKRGAEMGAKMHHPNVAATLDYYEDDQITFMVEEYIEGKDLGKRLDEEFFYLDPALTAHVLSHIAKALLQAHNAGICHRDLKPSNVMISGDASFSSIKLTDFGIAKLAENEIAAEIEMFEKDESTLTKSNTLLGAVPYMAPECWTDWKGAGKPVDIWALGCITYQLLHGQTPFGNGRAAIVKVAMAEHKGLELTKPSWFGKHPNTVKLEEDLWAIVLKCIQIKPESRITAQNLVEECSKLSYPSDVRQIGVIQTYPTRYGTGGVGRCGFISSTTEDLKTWFFHYTDFYGAASAPKIGDKVSFCAYEGNPYHRASPVLLVK